MLNLHATAFSAEYRKDEQRSAQEIPKQPVFKKPDLSCSFEKTQYSGSIWIWIQNNTPWWAYNFSVHVEAVREGVKVFDSTYSDRNMSGNDKAPIDLIPCKPGQKFTGVVDYGGSIIETNETNNTCEYNCNVPMNLRVK